MLKKAIILPLLFVCSMSFAQVFVANVDINKKNIEYVEVWDNYDKESGKFMAMVDYGQEDNRDKDKKGQQLMVTSANGATLQFNGIVHILNYMHRNGWEIVHIKDMGDYESYLMKRKADFSLMPISGSDQ